MFAQNHEKFLKNEEILIRKSNNKRKAKMQSITLEELREFASNYKHIKNDMHVNNEEKMSKLKEQWSERRGLLPKYSNPAYLKAELENQKKNDEKMLQEVKINNLQKRKKKFCGKVSEKKPHIDKKLKQEREDKITILTKNYTGKDRAKMENDKRKAIKERNKMQKNHSYDNLYKSVKTQGNKQRNQENSLEIKNDSYIKRPKKYHYFVNKTKDPNEIYNRKNRDNPNKKIDYLREIIKEREEKEKKRAGSAKNGKTSALNQGKKWDKILKNSTNKYELLNNMNNIKMKVQSLEEDAKRKEKFLKLNGGIKNNPDLGEKVGNILIDTIEAKLSILNQMNKE